MMPTEPVNILVVDDVPEKAVAIEATLADLGQNIVKAHSGREALRCLLYLYERDEAVPLIGAG